MTRRLEALSMSMKGMIIIALTLASLITASVLAIASLTKAADELKVASQETLPRIEELGLTEAKLMKGHLEVLRFVSWTLMGVQGETMSRQVELINVSRQEIADILATNGDAEDPLLSPQVVDILEQYLGAASEAVDMTQLDPSIGGMMINEADALFASVIDEFEADLAARNAETSAKMADQAANANDAVWTFIAIAAVSLLVTLTATTFVVRSVNHPMMRMAEAMSRLAEDETEIDIPGEGLDNEIGAMANAVAIFRDNAKARRSLEVEEAKRMEAAANRQAKSAALQDELAVVLDAASRGDLAGRLAENHDVHELDDLARSMNALLSGIEQTFIDVASELREMAQAGDTDDDEGNDPVSQMKRALGSLREDLADRARLAERERSETAARAVRANAIASFQADLNAVVDAASAGDFSRRVESALSEDDLRVIAERMNTLMSGVETAVSATSKALNAFAEGDLGARMQGDFKGVFAHLQRDANATGQKLQELVHEISSEAAQLHKSAQSIVGGAEDLSRRAASQAASLEETTANMHVLTETIRDNAKNAAEANVMSEETSRVALTGGKIVGEARDAMRLVDESAKKISDITALVDDIAFQTNLLALNAGVEAARAGEAGQGFAVVAQEVRSLSQRAADAANDIKTLISHSGEHVDTCAELVQASNEAFTSVGEGIAKVTEAFRSITEASQEQSNGIDEMRSVVSQLDQQTQNNANLATQSAESASDLVSQADRLTRLVAFFQSKSGEIQRPEAA